MVGPVLRTILVDDDASMRYLLKQELEGSGKFTVVAEAENGVVGIREVERCKADLDLVLLDVNMPVMGGVQALPHIRQAAPHALVVFVTMHLDRAIHDALARGATHVLDKGLDGKAIMEGLLRFAHARKAPATPSS